MPVRDLAMKVKINLGTIEVGPLSATVRDGKVAGGFKIDVTQDVPRADVDLRVSHMKLAYPRKPSVEGPLQGRVALQGRGNSLHELAANATGTVHRRVAARCNAVVARGARRLRSARPGPDGHRETRVTPASVAVWPSFDVKEGTLTAQRLLLDTDPVLITGEGTIDMDSEALELQLLGRPKHPRLRRAGAAVDSRHDQAT